MVEIEWTMADEDDADFVGGVGRHVTMLQGDWPGLAMHSERAAQEVAANYFDCDRWDVWFGYDCQEATVRIRIYSPEAIAGDYLIDLRFVPDVTRVKKLEVAPHDD